VEEYKSKNMSLSESLKKPCGWCFFPYKKAKLIKCSNCEELFCKSCLTNMGKRTFFCVSCCINLLRNNVDLLVINDTNDIKKKRTIRIPINRDEKIKENENENE